MTRTSLAIALIMIASTFAMAAGPSASYVSGGTVVVKEVGSAPAADDGFVVCGGGSGAGGACLPFSDSDSVLVLDDVRGRAVAFQVCIDNDGDGVCGGSGRDGAAGDKCADDIFYSHDDAGRFFNPLGPLPKAFREGCPGGAWNGYVVFLCEGVHSGRRGDGAHAHAATAGSISLVSGGTGYGDFCRPPASGSGKTYVVAGATGSDGIAAPL